MWRSFATTTRSSSAAFGDDPHQLQADVASLTQQLALGAENLPSRVESQFPQRDDGFGGVAWFSPSSCSAALGAFVRRRGAAERRPSAEVGAPQIP